MEQKKQTAGAKIYDFAQKNHAPMSFDEVMDVAKKSLDDFLPEMIECCESFRKTTTKSFYIVRITKVEAVLSLGTPTFSQKVFCTNDCPRPTWEQTVIYHDVDKGTYEQLWSIPDRDTCMFFLMNKEAVATDEMTLMTDIQRFYDGDLDKEMKQRNKEAKDSPLVEKEKLVYGYTRTTND